MKQRTHRPDGTPADEVLTNAEWLRLTGELLDTDLTLLASGATDAVTAHCLATLIDQVMDRHADEICDHCHEHLECHKAPGPLNPCMLGCLCSQATLSWLNAPCADPDED